MTEFLPDAVRSRAVITHDSTPVGAVLTCSTCQTPHEFFRTNAEPTYAGTAPQHHRCLDCNECYNGFAEDHCARCGSTQSELDREPPFGIRSPASSAGNHALDRRDA